MPVQFTCQHCDRTLSVSSRKAGERVTCPKCRRTTMVPVREVASVLAADVIAATKEPASPAVAAETAADKEASTPAPPSEASDSGELVAKVLPPLPPPPPTAAQEPLDVESWDAAADDEVTWVYESEQPAQRLDHAHLVVDFDRLALPRYVLYGQGILLGVVAIVALTLGFLIGRGSATPVVENAGPKKPCYLTGKVQYTGSGGSKSPDEGAVVIVVPQDQRPEEKATVEGLRPEDPLPSEDHKSLAQLKAIGADYARVDEQGNFKLRVPNTGEYFLLVISRHTPRKAADKLDSVQLAQMGRYFLPALDLIGDRRYVWQAETVKRDRDFKFTMD